MVNTINKLYVLYPDAGYSASHTVNIDGKDIEDRWRKVMSIVAGILTSAIDSPTERITDIELSEDNISGLYQGHTTIKDLYGEKYDKYYDPTAEDEERFMWTEERWPGQLDLYTAEYDNTLIAIYQP